MNLESSGRRSRKPLRRKRRRQAGMKRMQSVECHVNSNFVVIRTGRHPLIKRPHFLRRASRRKNTRRQVENLPIRSGCYRVKRRRMRGLRRSENRGPYSHKGLVGKYGLKKPGAKVAQIWNCHLCDNFFWSKICGRPKRAVFRCGQAVLLV